MDDDLVEVYILVFRNQTADANVIRLVDVGISKLWARFLCKIMEESTLCELLERKDTRWNEITADFLGAMLDALIERQGTIIRGHFGIGCEPTSLENIASEWKVSRERVRGLECQGIRKLRDPIRMATLVAVLDGTLPRAYTESALKSVLSSKGLDTPIESLGLTIAASRVVRLAHIVTVRDIYRVGRHKLLNTDGCGPLILKHILWRLASYGFSDEVSWEGEGADSEHEGTST